MDEMDTSGIEVSEATQQEWDDAITKVRVREAFALTFDADKTAELQSMQSQFDPSKKSLAFSNEESGQERVISVADAERAVERALSVADSAQYDGISIEELESSLQYNQMEL